MPRDRRPVVVLSANSCWNLVNFRTGLLNGLAEDGFEIVAFAPLDAQADQLRARGIRVEDVPVERSGMNPLADARLLLRYWRLLRRIRPAAYCGFTIKPNIYGAIAARLADVAAINNVTGLGTMFLSRSLMRQLAVALYRAAFRRSHVVFFHNEEDRQTFIDERIVTARQARVIPGSGVDLEWFRPEASKEPTVQPPRFLFVGRALRDKGIYEFVDAARRLRERLPGVRFQLLGNPDPGNPTSVTAGEFRSWVDEGIIEHLGEHADVRAFIAQATAIVLPTYREGMSRALLEGAAMGKPLIGTDVAGSRELVEEGVTGALCAPRDADSLANAIERIARLSASALAALGAAARKRVELGFGEQVVVDAYRQALAEIVGSK